MKRRIFVLIILILFLSGTTVQAWTFRGSSGEVYGNVEAASIGGKSILNEFVLLNYFMESFGDPSEIQNNHFMQEMNGWMTRTNKSSEKGEYQYLGYTRENIFLTNDRWFSSPSHLGTTFRPDYSGVVWHDITSVQGLSVDPARKWTSYRMDFVELTKYILSAPFFDSDHPTKGESPTGFNLVSLLPDNQWMTKSYLLSAPSPFVDGAVYLRYSKNGISDYNTIQIPALPRVQCVMTATPNVTTIERGTTRDVVVTIDTRESFALIYHEQLKSEITKRTYWAKDGIIFTGEPGNVSTQGVYQILVPTVSPNTTITVKATVFSQKVADMGQPAEDSQTTTLFIGETVSPNTKPTDNVAGIYMDAAANAVLRADTRDREAFDVAKGIPSTETLYAQIGGREYLIRQTYNEVTGTIPYTVSVRHPVQPALPDPALLEPLPDSIPPDPPLPTYTTTTVQVSRNYSFWEISSLEVYALESATLRSVALPGGVLALQPQMSTSQISSQPSQQSSSTYSIPSVDFLHRMDDLFTYHLETGSTNRSVSASSWDPASIQSMAQSAVSALPVRNDRLRINGKTVLDDSITSVSGIRPVPAVPGFLSRDALYTANLAIPAKTGNGLHPTTGTIRYVRLPDSVVNGGTQTSLVQPIAAINAVMVHTPVVLSAGLVSDDVHNQNPQADKNTGSIVLGRPFLIQLSNSGNHLGYPGYGDRDYSKYVADREVRLSFDSYLGNLNTGKFLQAGVWYSLTALGIPNTEGQLELKTPVWVQPVNHVIEVRTIAVNDVYAGTRSASSSARMTTIRQSIAGTPQLTGRVVSGIGANLQMPFYAVSVSIPVNVVGRMYDFQITDVEDPMWETFFRTSKGSVTSTGKRFSTGTRSINGDFEATRTTILPVMPGKNTQSGYRDRAVKLGYGIRFEMKTVGDFFDGNDVIRIHPTFFHVDKDGKNRSEVDLYYSLPGKPLVRVGSPEDTAIWSGKINLAYRGLTETEWSESGKALWQMKGGITGYASESIFAKAFLQGSQNGVDMFRTWRILMGESVRTFRGPTSTLPPVVNKTLAFASMQKWYGEYRLPSDTLIVPKDTDLSRIARITPKDPVFIKEGYLLINFRSMEVVNNGDYAHPVLLYSGRDMDASSASKASGLNGVSPTVADKGNGWLLEGYQTSQTSQPSQTNQSNQPNQPGQPSQPNQSNKGSWDLREGDAIAFYANRRSTDDLTGLGTH